MNKDQKYLSLCDAGAEIFSTCTRRKVFAILLSSDGHTIGTGYNGSPAGYPHCEDGACPRALEPNVIPGSNYDNCIAVHAEANCLLYSDRIARMGGTLYVNGLPCFGCAKLLAGSGIARLVCKEDFANEPWDTTLAFLLTSGMTVDVVSYSAC